MPAPHNIYYFNNPSTANNKSKISKLLLPHNNSNVIEDVKNEKADLFVLYSLHSCLNLIIIIINTTTIEVHHMNMYSLLFDAISFPTRLEHDIMTPIWKFHSC